MSNKIEEKQRRPIQFGHITEKKEPAVTVTVQLSWDNDAAKFTKEIWDVNEVYLFLKSQQ